MLYVYGKTGNKKILKQVLKEYRKFRRKGLFDDFAPHKKSFAHGVTYNEIAKLGAIIYRYTRDRQALKMIVLLPFPTFL